jgi:hypothetical protein
MSRLHAVRRQGFEREVQQVEGDNERRSIAHAQLLAVRCQLVGNLTAAFVVLALVEQ